MANNPNFANTAVVGMGAIAAATAANTGNVAVAGVPTSGVSLLVGATTGTRVQNIIAQGGTTVASSIILWLYNGTTSYPFDSFAVPANTPTTNGVTPPWTQNKTYPLLIVPSGSTIYATTTVTGQSVALLAFGASF